MATKPMGQLGGTPRVVAIQPKCHLAQQVACLEFFPGVSPKQHLMHRGAGAHFAWAGIDARFQVGVQGIYLDFWVNIHKMTSIDKRIKCFATPPEKHNWWGGWGGN